MLLGCMKDPGTFHTPPFLERGSRGLLKKKVKDDSLVSCLDCGTGASVRCVGNTGRN